MSKGKRRRFHLKSGETLVKRGMMDFCVTGEYRFFVAGDAILTDKRFYFGGDDGGGDEITLEVPLSSVYFVSLTGIPCLTRSILLETDRGRYRLNAVFPSRWKKAIERAVAAAKAENSPNPPKMG